MMFPANLHKNIVQLDKQISLLENECKTMEVENKRNYLKPQRYQNKCGKLSRSNPSSTKLESKHSNSKTRSSNSSPSSCSKPWSENEKLLLGKRLKQESVTDFQVCPYKNTGSYFHRNQKCAKSLLCNKDVSVNTSKKDVDTYNSNNNVSEDYNKDQVLHKEVLFSSSGGRIEVTVTQKPHTEDTKENFPYKNKNHISNVPIKDASVCHCQIKGQKWSDILALDANHHKSNSGSSFDHDNLGDKQCNIIKNCKTHLVQKPFCCSLKKLIDELPEENENFGNKASDVPVKLIQNISSKKLEKETQCSLISNGKCMTALNDNDIMHLFESVINELKHKPNEEKKKLLKDMIMKINYINGKEDLGQCDQFFTENDFRTAVKVSCENMIKDNELLSKEIMTKNNQISALQKREEEFLSVISSLKLSLEKAKEEIHSGNKALKELNHIKHKFIEHTKISDALKKSHSKMQEVLERYVFENDKLKTQIQIFKLESQKHDVLLAGKEAEIKQYREEILNFQKQISEHLAILKSNSQTIDIEKIMEAVFQQSQVFLLKDTDSVLLEKECGDISKQNNRLMHSSPTSAKSSVINSSWKQISSIQDHDQMLKNSEILNESNDKTEKEFFEVYGGDSSSETKSKETLIENSEIKELKKSSDFKSFISLCNKNDCDYSLPLKKNSLFPQEKAQKESKSLTSKKVQSSIDELLQGLKLKWSKDLLGTSPENGTIEDFLNEESSSENEPK